MTALLIDNSGDGNIAGGRQIFLHAGSGSNGAGTHEDRADMCGITKGSINSYNRAVRMLLFNFRIYGPKIQGVSGIVQGAVDREGPGGLFFQDGTYKGT